MLKLFKFYQFKVLVSKYLTRLKFCLETEKGQHGKTLAIFCRTLMLEKCHFIQPQDWPRWLYGLVLSYYCYYCVCLVRIKGGPIEQ